MIEVDGMLSDFTFGDLLEQQFSFQGGDNDVWANWIDLMSCSKLNKLGGGSIPGR